jgi:hypothetical protein
VLNCSALKQTKRKESRVVFHTIAEHSVSTTSLLRSRVAWDLGPLKPEIVHQMIASLSGNIAELQLAHLLLNLYLPFNATELDNTASKILRLSFIEEAHAHGHTPFVLALALWWKKNPQIADASTLALAASCPQRPDEKCPFCESLVPFDYLIQGTCSKGHTFRNSRFSFLLANALQSAAVQHCRSSQTSAAISACTASEAHAARSVCAAIATRH